MYDIFHFTHAWDVYFYVPRHNHICRYILFLHPPTRRAGDVEAALGKFEASLIVVQCEASYTTQKPSRVFGKFTKPCKRNFVVKWFQIPDSINHNLKVLFQKILFYFKIKVISKLGWEGVTLAQLKMFLRRKSCLLTSAQHDKHVKGVNDIEAIFLFTQFRHGYNWDRSQTKICLRGVNPSSGRGNPLV